MATSDQPPPAAAAGDDPPATAGRDDSTGQALARSQEIREKARRRIQAARECVAAVRRRRFGPNAGSEPVADALAARPVDAREEIERSRQARARLAVMAAKLVQTEQTVAYIHEEMAGRNSRHAAQYRRAAEDPRQAARRAREIQHNAGSDPPKL